MTNNIDERKYIAKKLLTGSGFRMGSFLLGRLLQIVRVMVFARLFVPDDIGVVALAISGVTLASVLANFGFRESVIRSRESSQSLANTAFTLSLIFGIAVLILIVIGAPFFSRIFSADLDNYIRFLAIMALAIPLRFPQVFWEKEIDFKHPSVAMVLLEVVSTLVPIGVEIVFHLGIWSILIGYVSSFLISILYIWIFADFRPRVEIVREFLKPLLGFGTPLMVQGVNSEVMSRGDNLLIGAYHSTTQLAYYNFAWQIPMMISSLSTMLDSMLFPVYARWDENKDAIIRLFNLANKFWSINGSFFGFFILLYADEIVHILYGPKWSSVIPILRVMTISFVIRFCTGYSYDNLALVRGRTKYLMKWGFVNTILVFTLGLFMIQKMGPIGGAWFWTLQAIFLNPLVRLPLIYQELGTLEFFRHIWQPVFSGAFASLCSYLLLQLLPFTDTANLVTSILGYMVLYPILLFIVDPNLITDGKKILLFALR